MKIAVLSGKGGTGKTFVSVNLAAAASQAVYVDCDVEEPNGNIFLKPRNLYREEINIHIPVVNTDLCSACRRCVEFCRFNALALVNDQLVIFDDVCHACGGCRLFCPEKALSYNLKPIGSVEEGASGQITVLAGMLDIGSASGVPIIRDLMSKIDNHDDLVIIDCAPGSGCLVMESVSQADYCVLVAEPTIFGLHNLIMVYELVTLLHKPCGVVINKCLNETDPAEEFCLANNIKLLARIPFDLQLGNLLSSGKVAVRESRKWSVHFSQLLAEIDNEVHHETAFDS